MSDTGQSTNTNSFSNLNLIVKPDSGFEILIPYLKEDDLETEIRVFNSFDEDGDEDLVLNPDGNVEDPFNSLGCAFYYAEVCTIWKNGRTMLVSSVQPEDEAGNPVPGSNYSPAAHFMRRLSYKIFVENEKQQRGMETNIPKHWMPWTSKGTIVRPQPMFMVQCMASKVNGEVKRDMKKKMQWQGPYVFLIPKSAEGVFLNNVLKKEDEDEMLSLGNNRLGDFCSCAEGHLLRLSRFTQKSGGGKRGKISYSLSLGKKTPFREDQVKGIVRPWDELIHLPTVDETVRVLSKLFEPAVIDFGFRNTAYTSYVPEEFLGAADDIPEAEDIREIRAKNGPIQEERTAPRLKAPSIADGDDIDLPKVSDDSELSPEAFKKNLDKLQGHTMPMAD